LPPRLALEQEDALRAVAQRCGYSPPAVERAFRARYWTQPRERTRPVAGVALEQ
jgi:transcriptional regulator GlxA family with amidase domain